ncbi:hypothetical protein IW261DRAFT_1346034 [Armillaria novae-zelandiae]|uniref:Uncharacterized protein n=1 Tax=Armillaria novae-zelandiae TaxID=153914 RepID=A0AA39NN18_9AGAR|nr:hypothetical protein IW261DRAFT_1346034 [Armillaria novae-zelandiae]
MYSNVFVFGQNTSVEAIVNKLFVSSTVSNKLIVECSNLHNISVIELFNCSIIPSHNGNTSKQQTIQEYLDVSSNKTLKQRCTYCYAPVYKKDLFESAPPLLAVLVSSSNTPADPHIELQIHSQKLRYNLQGIIYFGHTHFTAQYIDNKHNAWFHDGLTLECNAKYEGNIHEIDLADGPNDQIPELYIYTIQM